MSRESIQMKNKSVTLANNTENHESETKSTLETKRPLKIVHLVSSLKVGGMEQVVLSLTEAQQNDGHSVHIVSLNGGPLEESVKKRNLNAQVVAGKNKYTRIIHAARLLAHLSPDIIHAHNPTSLHYAVIGKLVGKAKVLMTDHAQTRGVVRVPSSLEHRYTDAVVAVSQDTATQATARGWADPITVIYNGVSLVPSRRDPLVVRAELGLGSEAVGIMVAGFDKVKGHSVLLEARASLPADLPLTLLLVGGGQERPALETQAKQLGLDLSLILRSGWIRC